jgi:hypothetical protein
LNRARRRPRCTAFRDKHEWGLCVFPLMATELAHLTPGLCKRFRAEHAIFDYALCGAPIPHEAKAAIAHVAPDGAIPVARRKARGDTPARDRPSPVGPFTDAHRQDRRRPSALRSERGALRSYRASPAGDAIWPRRPVWQPYAFGPLALWLLGYPDAALADAKQALREARDIGQAVNLLFALLHTSLTHIQCRNYAVANAEADKLAALTNEKGSSFWKALGMRK